MSVIGALPALACSFIFMAKIQYNVVAVVVVVVMSISL